MTTKIRFEDGPMDGRCISAPIPNDMQPGAQMRALGGLIYKLQSKNKTTATFIFVREEDEQ